MSYQFAREQMVKQQVRAWDVLDPRVLDVLDALPREEFVPQAYRGLAYADTQIPLPHGQAMMAPKVEGRLLQALDPQPQETTLEIGTGSGFVTACLARLAHTVFSVDIFPEFTAGAAGTLKQLGIGNLQLETRDATQLTWATQRFDLIAITASLPAYDRKYGDRLTVGGRMFVIVGQPPIMEALLITRVAEDAWARESLFETALPPLINAVAPPAFRF
ncbi:MAG: protein-L-isoaspartate O-methyltransferase family protein [Gammaproteobacteria bacterium]